jgi:hypothetical protein
VLCFQTRAQRSPSVAVETVKKARGAGVIFAQFLTKDIASSFGIPCVQVDYQVGTAILAYTTSLRYVNRFGYVSAVVKIKYYNIVICHLPINFICSLKNNIYCRNPTVQFSSAKTILGELIGPEVAYFSSRGPSSLSPAVLKVKLLLQLLLPRLTCLKKPLHPHLTSNFCSQILLPQV